MNHIVNRRERGAAAERLAADFLATKGMKIVRRNYRYERGEIDIVAEDGDELVFVEVKWRRSGAFGSPEDAITPAKQDQIIKVAEGYLFENGIEGRPCRFDVVAVTERNGNQILTHYVNAF
jgi:putative endonuclease